MGLYPTVAEVTESARRLVSRFPGDCRLRRIGTSRAGRPIRMLSLGHGPRHILVVAGAHPDEPVGGATALALAERVARGDRRSGATDLAAVTWNIVLCLDPDGAALGEGVTRGAAPAAAEHTLNSYYRTAFRPVAAEQPEWAPIIPRQLPESQALFQVIDELRPFLQCSLHGIEAGGSWVQLTRNLPQLAGLFRTSAEEFGIPLQHGTYDALNWENPDPAVHVLPPADMPPPDGSGRPTAGTENLELSTWCAPMGYGGLTMIVEVPMWATDLADDPSPHPRAGHALRELTALMLDGGGQVTAVLDKARGFLPTAQDSPLVRVLEWMADDLYTLVAATWEPLAREAATAEHAGEPGQLTTAQVAALDIVARRQPLRAAGILLRLLENSPDRAAPGLLQELEGLFTTWCTDFSTALGLRWVPVRHQVEHQARTVTAAAECALKTAE